MTILLDHRNPIIDFIIANRNTLTIKYSALMMPVHSSQNKIVVKINYRKLGSAG